MQYHKIVLAALCLIGANSSTSQSATTTQGQNTTAQGSGTPIIIGEAFRVNSKRLGEAREIRVYLPSSYAGTNQRYPVIYTLDGEGTGSITASCGSFSQTRA